MANWWDDVGNFFSDILMGGGSEGDSSQFYTPSIFDALSSVGTPGNDSYGDTFFQGYQDSAPMFTSQGNNEAEKYMRVFDEPGGSVASMLGGSETSPWETFSNGLQSAGGFASSKGGQLAIGGLGGLASYLDAKKKNSLMKKMMEQAAAEKAARAAKAAVYDAPLRVTNTKTALPTWGAGQQAFSGNSLREMTPRTGSTMYAAEGGYVSGGSLGQADKVPAMLSDGEYVVDADVVSALGDGNNAAGVSALAQMSENIRKHKRNAPVHKIPPKAKSPETYLKGAK